MTAPGQAAGMRSSGLVDRTSGLGAHDHVCWRYTAPDELRARARDFLADGLAQGLQVWYVAPGTAAELTGDLRGVDGLDVGLRTGPERSGPGRVAGRHLPGRRREGRARRSRRGTG